MPAPADAIHQQIAWKNSEMRNFATALVRHALEKLGEGSAFFTTDIVSDAERGDGHSDGLLTTRGADARYACGHLRFR